MIVFTVILLEWEVKVRQTGSLCLYNTLTDEMCRDKFIFRLKSPITAELPKTDGVPNTYKT